MIKISSKIMVTIVLCSVFTLILVGGFSLYQGSKYIKEQAKEKLTFMGMSYANEFSQTIKETESYVDSLYTAILSSFDIEKYRKDADYIAQYQDQLDEIIKLFSTNDNNALGIYVTFDPYLTDEAYEVWYEDIENSGQMFRVTEELIKEKTSSFTESWMGYPNSEIFRNRDDEAFAYLYKTMEEKEPFWFEPYKESGLDIMVISYVKPLIIGEYILGVVGMDISFETIESTVNNVRVFDSGYAVLLNERNQIITHSGKGASLKQINGEHFKKLLIEPDKSEGIIEYSWEKNKNIYSFSKLSNGWTLCLAANSNEIYKPVISLSKWMVVLTLTGMLLSIFIAYLFSKRVSRTMEGAAKQLRYIEIGDFTREIPKELLESRDDLGQFIKSVHAIQETMKTLIGEAEQKGFYSYYNSSVLNNSLRGDYCTLEKAGTGADVITETLPYTYEVPFAEFRSLDESEELTLRVSGALGIYQELDLDEQMQNLDNLKEEYLSGNVRLTSTKFFADGVVEGLSADLLEPYDVKDENGNDINGYTRFDYELMKEAFLEVNKRGVQVHVHSIGDKANKKILDAFEYVNEQLPGKDFRNAITHIQLLDPPDIQRFKDLNVIGVVQPFWHLKEPGWWDVVDYVMLGERAEKEYPLQSLISAGITIASSSDYAVTPEPNPFWAIEAGVTRNLNNADSFGVEDIKDIDDPQYLLNKEERASVEDMIRSYTINSAFHTFRDNEIGSIEVGKFADLIVVDQDITKINPIDIDRTKVLYTIFNGNIVYRGE